MTAMIYGGRGHDGEPWWDLGVNHEADSGDDLFGAFGECAAADCGREHDAGTVAGRSARELPGPGRCPGATATADRAAPAKAARRGRLDFGRSAGGDARCDLHDSTRRSAHRVEEGKLSRH